MTLPVIIVGGFLGAGKTTLLLAAAQRLTARGLRVGMVTNDQGNNLVDSVLVQRTGVAVAEVVGGCFCCRYPDLVNAFLTLQQTASVDVILAEPVGSCTDLLATVVRPLLHYHGDHFRLAPLTIAHDPLRANTRFLAEVDYLLQRQLAEAEVIAVTKQDLYTEAKTNKIAELLRYDVGRVFRLSAVTGAGVDEWLNFVLANSSTAHKKLEIDYCAYAAGEAALGWLNVSGSIASDKTFSPRNWAYHLLRLFDAALSQVGAEIAHIKLYVCALTQHEPTDMVYKASITHSQGPIIWDLAPPADSPTRKLKFLLNARVQAPPGMLEAIARSVLNEVSPKNEFDVSYTNFECFRPGAPHPTYRM
jgi:Ni2+-binding GTPase involved in maturation of urease and hydrogenase